MLILIYTLFGIIMVLQNIDGESTEIRIPHRDGEFTVGAKARQTYKTPCGARAGGARKLDTGSYLMQCAFAPDRQLSVGFPLSNL